MRDIKVRLLCLVLLIIGLGLAVMKYAFLGLPLTPDQTTEIWMIESRVEFSGMGRSSRVTFDLPDDLSGYEKLDEFFVSRNYGLSVYSKNNNRRAEWSTRSARGKQRLYYRIELIPRSDAERMNEVSNQPPSLPVKPQYEEPLASAIEDTLSRVRNESADIFTFTSQLLIQMNDPAPTNNVLAIRKGIEPGSEQWVKRLQYVLHGAYIPTRLVRGASLVEESSDLALIPWLEVHNGERWEGFDPLTGDQGYPDAFLRWNTGSEELLQLEGGQYPNIHFTLSRIPYSSARIYLEKSQSGHSIFYSWSLHKLPLATQNVYRILLMIPLGVLIIVLMRTYIGMPCFGTFMPVLIALAFRETELIWGVILFLFITSAGLMFRFSLERMNLLLVPRLSTVLVMVILMMLLISLISHDLDIERGISIALFPIVILAMVIERISILWEESGAGEAVQASLGSLFIAILSYYVMTNDHLEYLVFNFPELHLITLAIIMISGRYTGYRINELLRFRDLAGQGVNKAKKDV